jgi:hypothetical protein
MTEFLLISYKFLLSYTTLLNSYKATNSFVFKNNGPMHAARACSSC